MKVNISAAAREALAKHAQGSMQDAEQLKDGSYVIELEQETLYELTRKAIPSDKTLSDVIIRIANTKH